MKQPPFDAFQFVARNLQPKTRWALAARPSCEDGTCSSCCGLKPGTECTCATSSARAS